MCFWRLLPVNVVGRLLVALRGLLVSLKLDGRRVGVSPCSRVAVPSPLVARPVASNRNVLLVDANNLRGVEDFELSLHDTCIKLAFFAAAHGLRGRVVAFVDFGPGQRCFSRDGIMVVFSGMECSADDLIVREVAWFAQQRRSTWVASSDRQLRQRCEASVCSVSSTCTTAFIESKAFSDALMEFSSEPSALEPDDAGCMQLLLSTVTKRRKARRRPGQRFRRSGVGETHAERLRSTGVFYATLDAESRLSQDGDGASNRCGSVPYRSVADDWHMLQTYQCRVNEAGETSALDTGKRLPPLQFATKPWWNRRANGPSSSRT